MSSVPSFKNSTRGNVNRPSFDPERIFLHEETPSFFFSLWSGIRCIRRIIALFFWSILGCIIQSILLLIPGQMFRSFPLTFWKIACHILGLNVQKIGELAGSLALRNDKRRIIFVANHSSWLDILVMGQIVPAFFVAKQDVRSWPLIGFLTRLGGTIYVTRSRQEAGQDVQDILERLRKGYNIIFFPEGTTSNGASVLPFLSSLFAIAKPLRSKHTPQQDVPPCLIQPVSLTYDRLEGLPVTPYRRTSVFSWFGDMYLAPHLWGLGKWRSMQASVLFHPPLKPEDFPSRKALSNTARKIIAQGNEDLRQNRLSGVHTADNK